MVRSAYCQIGRHPQAPVTRPVNVILTFTRCFVSFSINISSSIIIISVHVTSSLCQVRMSCARPFASCSVPLDAIQKDDFRKSPFKPTRSGWCGASATWTWQWTFPPAVWLCQLRRSNNCLAPLEFSSLASSHRQHAYKGQLRLAIGIPTSRGCLENRGTFHPLDTP